MARYSLSLWLCLGALIALGPTSRAQNRASTPKSSAARSKSAPKSSPLLPLLAGGALLMGFALGVALKKPRAAPPSHDSNWFDQMPFPLALVDENERFIRKNAAFEHFFGAESAQLPDLLHPGDLPRARGQLREIVEKQRAGFELPCRFFGADGAPLHAVMSGQTDIGLPASAKNLTLLSYRDTSAQAGAELELCGAREAVSALARVISGDKTRDLDSKIKSLLSMGCGRFELPIGVLGRFAGENFETLWVQSADRRIRPALSLPRKTLNGEVLGEISSEAELLGLAFLPRPQHERSATLLAKNERNAYFGAPVTVDDEPFGMLSFSGLSRRDQEFSDGEIELLQLMAQWVGGEIERQQARDSLAKQQKALVEANEKLERLATHDGLTGIKNRRAFQEKLDEEWSRARRYGTPLSLIIFDIDKFKLFNDSFGHVAGDGVLQRVASVVMAAIRVTDFFARYGGEEFVMILPNTDIDGALILADRLRIHIENAPWKERQITASVGVATLFPGYKTAAELLEAADGALYKSKEGGRNRVTHARPNGGGEPDNQP